EAGVGGEAGAGGGEPLPFNCNDPNYPQACPSIGAYDGGCWPETSDCATILRCGDGSFHACRPGWLSYCDQANEFHCRRDPAEATDIVLVDTQADALLPVVNRLGDDWNPTFTLQVLNLGGLAAPYTRARVFAVPLDQLYFDAEICQMERFETAYTVGEQIVEGPGGDAEIMINIPTSVISRVENRALPVGRYVWFSKVEVRATPDAAEQASETDYCNNYGRLPEEWEIIQEAP
ncbi:hypothetical protein KKB55_15650, partial [Myxococcota bacterium]|nr:hypothetical protein [Myxococcota bacterium]